MTELLVEFRRVSVAVLVSTLYVWVRYFLVTG